MAGIGPIPSVGAVSASPLGQIGGLGGQLGQLPGGGGDQAGGDDQAAAQGFGDMLKKMVMDRPSATHAVADDLATRFAAGDNIDPHNLAIATAKAGVEIQMATRTISQAVSAVRTLFQMQI